MSKRCAFLLILLLVCGDAYAQSNTVGINQVRNRSTYMFDLMKLALSKSGKKYEFVEASERLSKNAEREAALSGRIAVFWGGTSEEQERDFLPVRVDGYRGLMSLRFFIIRKEDQGRFSSVRNVDDLKQFAFGQGRGWKDGDILEAAGLKVERSAKKAGLFHMLDGSRFDAFPRGATEAWIEANANKDLGLVVEEKLVLKYPLPTYFFFNKDRKALARDVARGLEIALEDGSFDEFFYSNDRVQAFLREANLDQRRVIEINNPYLPKGDDSYLKYSLTPEQLIDGAKRIGER